MAKQTLPGIQSSGGSSAPKIVFGLIAVGFVALVIKSPTEAAHLVSNLMTGAGHVAESLMTFLEGVS